MLRVSVEVSADAKGKPHEDTAFLTCVARDVLIFGTHSFCFDKTFRKAYHQG